MTGETDLPTGVRIRPASADDVPAVQRLQLAMALEIVPGLSEARAAEYARQLREHLEAATPSAAERVFLAVTAGGMPVATATLRIVHRAPYPRSRLVGECQVTEVYTEPGWRRQGIGRALALACIDEARLLGLRRVYLRTTGAGRGLYEELGFTDPGYTLQLDLD